MYKERTKVTYINKDISPEENHKQSVFTELLKCYFQAKDFTKALFILQILMNSMLIILAFVTWYLKFQSSIYFIIFDVFTINAAMIFAIIFHIKINEKLGKELIRFNKVDNFGRDGFL